MIIKENYYYGGYYIGFGFRRFFGLTLWCWASDFRKSNVVKSQRFMFQIIMNFNEKNVFGKDIEIK